MAPLAIAACGAGLEITPPIIPIVPISPIVPIGPAPAAPRPPAPAPTPVSPPSDPGIAVAALNGFLSAHRGYRIADGGQPLGDSRLVRDPRLLGGWVRARRSGRRRAQQQRHADRPGRNDP